MWTFKSLIFWHNIYPNNLKQYKETVRLKKPFVIDLRRMKCSIKVVLQPLGVLERLMLAMKWKTRKTHLYIIVYFISFSCHNLEPAELFNCFAFFAAQHFVVLFWVINTTLVTILAPNENVSNINEFCFMWFSHNYLMWFTQTISNLTRLFFDLRMTSFLET